MSISLGTRNKLGHLCSGDNTKRKAPLDTGEMAWYHHLELDVKAGLALTACFPVEHKKFPKTPQHQTRRSVTMTDQDKNKTI